MATVASNRGQWMPDSETQVDDIATPWSQSNDTQGSAALTANNGVGSQLWFRFLVLNSAGAAAVVCAWYVGLVDIMLQADQTRLCIFIATVFIVGLGYCARSVWSVAKELSLAHAALTPPNAVVTDFLREIDGKDSTSRQVAVGNLRLEQSQPIQIVRHIANALVLLGLVGTVVGFIIALSAIDPELASDIDAITPMVATLIQGMSTALYTTLIGAVLNLWLMANCQVLSAGVVKLITSLTRLGERRAGS